MIRRIVGGLVLFFPSGYGFFHDQGDSEADTLLTKLFTESSIKLSKKTILIFKEIFPDSSDFGTKR